MMEQLFSQDLTVTTLLGLFIVGILTKRFVPWWVYEDLVKKLKEYEETAPELIDEMQRMMAILEDPHTADRLSGSESHRLEEVVTKKQITSAKTTTLRPERRRTRPQARRDT